MAAEEGSGTAVGASPAKYVGGKSPNCGAAGTYGAAAVGGVMGQKCLVGGDARGTSGPETTMAGGVAGKCVEIAEGGASNAPPPASPAGINLHTCLNHPRDGAATFAT